eukprot:2536898-Rhodomonas_salina.1
MAVDNAQDPPSPIKEKSKESADFRPRPKKLLPSWYGTVLHVPEDVRLALRIRMQGAVGCSVKRGKLLPGWRPIIKMKK